MLTINDIRETINMIQNENLDVRTITMGISLYDCVSDDINKLCDNIYDKITHKAENIVKVGDGIGKKYGIPIVNKRVSVTPVALIGGKATSDDYVKIAKTLDRAGKAVGVNFIGGFSALVQKGMSYGSEQLIKSIPQALTETDFLCSSLNVASTKAGINMDAIYMAGKAIKELAYLTKDKESIGCAKFVVFANAPEDNPFMAGAFHGIGEPECVINVGVSGPGVVAAAIKRAVNCDFCTLAN
ncbi:MAG: DUF711 family protein, partial [Clostridia bacterium]|nr:DUF711 family protein [Clostridia bacterium]